MESPYMGVSDETWEQITYRLVQEYPLREQEIIDVVLQAWEDILQTKIANKLQIGIDIFPTPQILGNFLHELIPFILQKKYPTKWRRDINKKDKDLVCIDEPKFSTEIKTSSDKNNIYGNASYGIEDSSALSLKSKDGYYLAINFEKFNPDDINYKPRITKIRLGWLDHSDWHSQGASSGQQSRIPAKVRDKKLKLLYDAKTPKA